jgi:hypothetical protein
VRRFSISVGIGSSVAMLLLVATPAIEPYLRVFAGLPRRLEPFVTCGLMLSVILPAINSLHSWYRGLLMSERRTHVIYWGMGLNLAVTGAVVLAGVLLQSPGVETAVIALGASLALEVWYLRARLLPRSSSV